MRPESMGGSPLPATAKLKSRTAKMQTARTLSLPNGTQRWATATRCIPNSAWRDKVSATFFSCWGKEYSMRKVYWLLRLCGYVGNLGGLALFVAGRRNGNASLTAAGAVCIVAGFVAFIASYSVYLALKMRKPV